MDQLGRAKQVKVQKENTIIVDGAGSSDAVSYTHLGTLGIFGISLGLALMIVNLCSVNAYGIPSMAPESPFQMFAMRDLSLIHI